mmetsp:Transcript_67965/g.202325  ORF Transcript_67965/g.202325 Transcript_67965/m.202325 type:complete len:227 (+) Transcript_67965:550-1230(+)
MLPREAPHELHRPACNVRHQLRVVVPAGRQGPGHHGELRGRVLLELHHSPPEGSPPGVSRLEGQLGQGPIHHGKVLRGEVVHAVQGRGHDVRVQGVAAEAERGRGPDEVRDVLGPEVPHPALGGAGERGEELVVLAANGGERPGRECQPLGVQLGEDPLRALGNAPEDLLIAALELCQAPGCVGERACSEVLALCSEQKQQARKDWVRQHELTLLGPVSCDTVHGR